MIIGIESQSDSVSLQNFKPSFGAVNDAAFTNTFEDNPTRKFFQYMEFRDKNSQGEKISKDEALKRTKEQKVEVKNIPDEGITEDALNLLIERQYQSKKRSEVLNAANAGFVRTALPSLVAGFLDPVNIAADLALGAGLSKLARLGAGGATLGVGFNKVSRLVRTANAGRRLNRSTRLAARAGKGAIEGGVVAAGMEPFNYLLSQELGDDYDSFDSLVNVGFGVGMGSLFEMGVQGGLDYLKQRNLKKGKFAEYIQAKDPEVQEAYLRTAVSEMAEDRNVDISPIMEAEKIDLETKINELKREVLSANESKDFSKLDILSKRFEDLQRKLGDPLNPKEAESSFGQIGQEAEQGILDSFESYKSPNRDAEFLSIKREKQNQPKLINEINVDKQNGKATVTATDGYDLEPVKTFDDLDSAKKYAANLKGYVEAGNDASSISETISKFKESEFGTSEFIGAKRPFNLEPPNSPELLNKRIEDFRKRLAETDTKPNSRYLDEGLIKKHQKEISELPDNSKVEEAEALALEEFEDLKDYAEQAGVDIEAELKSADELVDSADELTDSLKRLARCMTRKT